MRKRQLASSQLEGELATSSPAVTPQEYVNAIWTGDKVALLWREPDGRLSKREVPAEYACHIRLSDWNDELERSARSSRAIKGYAIEGSWVRLRWVSRELCREFCGPRGFFEQKNIPTFEADLHPVRRYFVEHPEVKIQKPLRGYLDLETDSRVPFALKEEARILCWGFRNHETGDRVQGVLEEDTDAAECRLIEDLWDELAHVDQIAAWSGGVKGSGIFDFEVLFARTRRYNIRVYPPRWLWISHLEAFQKLNMSASGSGEEKQSMALGRVAEGLGIPGKEDFDASKTWEAWLAGGEQLERMCSYNMRDVDVMAEIENKTGYLDLLYSVCSSCGTFPDQRGMNGTAYVESFLLRLAQGRDLHFRSHWGMPENHEQYEGAFVLKPVKLGILRGVHVCDFAGLYPSIIESWNMSPETIVPHLKRESGAARPSYLAHLPVVDKPLPPDHARAPNTGVVFNLEIVGLLALAVTELKRQRAYYSKLQASFPPGTPAAIDAARKSAGYKVCVNTFYGVAGSPFSRFFEVDVAESVSTTGAWLIKRVIKAAEERGMKVISGDTDSAFVVGVSEETFRAFVDELNEVLIPAWLTEPGVGVQRNEISMAYEKEFDVLIYTVAKKYAGRYAHYKGKRATAASKPEIKGFEYKRGDAVRLARQMQLEVVEKLLQLDKTPCPVELPYTAEDFVSIVERWRDRVLLESLEPRDFVMAKKLSKSIKSYKQREKKDGSMMAQPVHVEVARKMQAQGLNVSEGTRIEYVVTDGSVTPQQAVAYRDFKPGTEDRHYLWETLIWPATERVLAVCFPQEKWERFNKTRPPKLRKPRGAKAVADEQLSFFGDALPGTDANQNQQRRA